MAVFDPKIYMKHMEADLERVLENAWVHVFVMGPSPTPESDASRLRRAIIEKCREYGYTALMEHGEIIASVRSRAGTYADLAFIEEVHAATVHVLVFLPSSPGSFAELGFFAGLAWGMKKGGDDASATAIINKSVILLDEAQVPLPADNGDLVRGFVADGPALMLEDLGAKVFYVPYGDIEKAWRHVQRRVEAARRFESTRTRA